MILIIYPLLDSSTMMIYYVVRGSKFNYIDEAIDYCIDNGYDYEIFNS